MPMRPRWNFWLSRPELTPVQLANLMIDEDPEPVPELEALLPYRSLEEEEESLRLFEEIVDAIRASMDAGRLPFRNILDDQLVGRHDALLRIPGIVITSSAAS